MLPVRLFMAFFDDDAFRGDYFKNINPDYQYCVYGDYRERIRWRIVWSYSAGEMTEKVYSDWVKFKLRVAPILDVSLSNAILGINMLGFAYLSDLARLLHFYVRNSANYGTLWVFNHTKSSNIRNVMGWHT